MIFNLEESFMLEKILQILAQQLSLDTDSISLDSDIAGDLGADSLDIVQLADSFEREFDIVISEEEIMSVKTVEDILDKLEAKIGITDRSELKNKNQITW